MAYHPAVTFLGIYPKEFETHAPTKTCTQIFIGFSYNWQNLEATKYLSVGKWINKPLYNLKHGVLLSERKKPSSHKKTWSDLKCNFLRERSQSKKATSYMITIVVYSGKSKTLQVIKRPVVVRVWKKEMDE